MMEGGTPRVPSASPAGLQGLYRRHANGARFRSWAALTMSVVAWIAWLSGVVSSRQLQLVLAGVTFLILYNLPTLWVLARIHDLRLYNLFSLFVNLLEVLAYTWIIHALGGIDAAYLTPIYCILIGYLGVVAPRRTPFIVSVMCILAFSGMILMEYFGLLHSHLSPPFEQAFHVRPPLINQLMFVAAVGAMLFVLGFISSRTAHLLRKNRQELQQRAVELERRVRERTAELTRANRELAREVRDRRRAEAALAQSEELYRTLLETSPDAVVVTDVNARIRMANRQALKLYGYSSQEEAQANRVNTLEGVAETHRDQFILDSLETFESGRSACREYMLLKGDGTPFYGEVAVAVLPDEQGEPGTVISVIRDITDRKDAEERLKNSLREKEVLLSEVHHRVKNNMQVISSLINLQARGVKDNGVAEALTVVRNRVTSMALVHEALYRSESLADLDLGEYLSRMTNALSQSHLIGGRAPRLTVQVEPGLKIGIDKALPCGLILNELVSNALKYAFPEEQTGEIAIRAGAHDLEQVRLEIGDDGVGLPEGVELNHPNTLGLSLVNDLVRLQLKGSIDVGRGQGTNFVIIFRN
ncbi:MAG: PAS domain S-box protein [Proteobacteria bacterium]|nr:PAS domain S-box protein [Pseudomonadota bacterium]